MNHAFELNGAEYDIGLSRAASGYRLHLDGREIPIQMVPGEAGDWVLRSGDRVDHLAIALDGDRVWIHLDGRTHMLSFAHALNRLEAAGDAGTTDAIRATMPGSLISLAVGPGDAVNKGATLLVMESMKMETTIVAPRDGIVDSVAVAAGQTFDKGAVLLTLVAEDAS